MLNDIKFKLKEKGYSVVTIYEPKECVIVEILEGNRIIAEFNDIESDFMLGLLHRNSLILPNLREQNECR